MDYLNREFAELDFQNWLDDLSPDEKADYWKRIEADRQIDHYDEAFNWMRESAGEEAA